MGKESDFTKEAVVRGQSNSSDEDLPQYAPPSYEQASSSNFSRSPVPSLIPNVSKILSVDTRGNRSCGWSSSSNKLSINIYEGTETSREPVYVSTRAKRRSGNAVLRHAQRGDLYASFYKFGPFRDPVIRHVGVSSDVRHDSDEEGQLAVSTKSHTWNNKLDLTLADSGMNFTWRYGKTQLPIGKTRVMVLEANAAESSSEKALPRTLAVLLRTDETRTPGTSKWDAGNGGQLVIAEGANASMDEALIVASCIMMLKREIDRQQGAQAAAISGAGS